MRCNGPPAPHRLTASAGYGSIHICMRLPGEDAPRRSKTFEVRSNSIVASLPDLCRAVDTFGAAGKAPLRAKVAWGEQYDSFVVFFEGKCALAILAKRKALLGFDPLNSWVPHVKFTPEPLPRLVSRQTMPDTVPVLEYSDLQGAHSYSVSFRQEQRLQCVKFYHPQPQYSAKRHSERFKQEETAVFFFEGRSGAPYEYFLRAKAGGIVGAAFFEGAHAHFCGVYSLLFEPKSAESSQIPSELF